MTREHANQRSWVLAALDRFESPLVQYSARLLDGDVERARDVVQDAFLRLCQQCREDIEPRLAEWLFTVSRNAAFDVRRKERKMESIEAVAVPPSSNELGPATTAERNDEVSRVMRAIAGLPESQREVLQLRFQHGLTYKELGTVTGRSASAVGVLIHVGMKTLRSRLRGELELRLPEGTP
jgi:RNA polymerase sigma-70 factor (ECF subfamily)